MRRTTPVAASPTPPSPRSYSQKVNKKVVRLALTSALSDRANEGKILVVDTWGWDTPSSKNAAAALVALGIDGKALVILDRDDVVAAKSFRNLVGVQILEAGELNAYDVLCNDWIVFTTATLPTGSTSPKADRPKPAPKPKPASKADLTPAPLADLAPAPGAEGSASDEAQAARGGSAADDEPAVDSGAEGSASDEAQAARGGSAADDEPAVENGSAADDEPAVENGSAADDEPATPFGPGSAAAGPDGSGPDGFTIKGNADSMLYHLPDGRWYEATVAEVWFDSEESARAAGFTKAGARKPKTDAAEDAE